MIYALIGTGSAQREKALANIARLGAPTAHLYGEHVGDLEPLIASSSLFGEKIIVHLVQAMEKAEGRERVYELLPAMKESQNIFIIDEPFADQHRSKKIEKYADELYDAREEKEKETSPFALCNAFARRNKKEVWEEWMRLRDEIEPEAIQGALWWKWGTVWSDVKSGKPGKYSVKECEELGGRIMRSSILAHRGERDLKVEIESILLSI